jgi:hypothetical protein
MRPNPWDEGKVSSFAILSCKAMKDAQNAQIALHRHYMKRAFEICNVPIFASELGE